MKPAATKIRLYALVPCAGNGSRATGSDPAEVPVPKQYKLIAGKPMVLHTLAAFAAVARIERTLVVVAPGDDFFMQNPEPSIAIAIADCGGASRADSVRGGLQRLLSLGANASDWVLVHDAARCLTTPAQIESLIDACEHDEVGGLLAQPLADTLKSEALGRVAATVDRTGKWLAQTPQMFRIGPLFDALVAAGSMVTDESSAMEAAGLSPKLVPGSAQNFKVTYPTDFALAEAVLASRQSA